MEQQHGAARAAATNNNHCSSGRHGDDRDNLMMMKMMNSPHEPIPYGWEHPAAIDLLDAVTEYASVSSDSCSNCGSRSDDGTDDVMVQEQRPMEDGHHHFGGEESDLGEFLMDTFESVDVIAALEDMPELAAI